MKEDDLPKKREIDKQIKMTNWNGKEDGKGNR